MKRLPLTRRPYGAKRILEIGGGHAPYEGVTHAVDKYPDDNTQRADSLHIAPGVEFRQGDLESIPFDASPKFDFLYASHVLEHVAHPERAVGEINRVAHRGYLETPSPLREQVACPVPFDAVSDFHILYCWTAAQADTIHVLKKSAASVNDFCDCEDGKLAQRLSVLRRQKGLDVEPLLPREAKTTRLYFKTPLRLQTHSSFGEACRSGACAFGSAGKVRRWSGFPRYLISKRFKRLRSALSP